MYTHQNGPNIDDKEEAANANNQSNLRRDQFALSESPRSCFGAPRSCTGRNREWKDLISSFFDAQKALNLSIRDLCGYVIPRTWHFPHSTTRIFPFPCTLTPPNIPKPRACRALHLKILRSGNEAGGITWVSKETR